MSLAGPGRRLLALAARAWRVLRVSCGDAAYETYLARTRDTSPLSREAFYLDALRRRYRGPNRCC